MAYSRDDDILIDLDEEEDFEQIRAEAEARRAAAVPSPKPDIEAPELEEGKTHHLFISHSELDEEGEWASQLVHTLEQEHGLKCIWHRRDFTPGHEIADLIQTGIARSMKVLFIMTPASMESGWCKYERNWAFVLSVEERENRVIPLLLKPCVVPNIFKTINYIDVPKGEDYVHRILGSFDKENDLNHVVPDLERFLKGPMNGLKTEICGKKRLKYMCSGPAWGFYPPSEYQRYLLRKLGSKFAEDVYHKASNVVNSTNHLRFYGLRRIPCHCCMFYCFSVLLAVTGVLSLFYIVLFAAQINLELSYGYMILLVFLIGILIPIPLFSVDSSNYIKARNLVRDFSLSQVSKTKVLVNYCECCGPPRSSLDKYSFYFLKASSNYDVFMIHKNDFYLFGALFQLAMMYYDIIPCANYIRDGILRTPTLTYIDDIEERKESAQYIAEKTVIDFLKRSYELLFTWKSLEISEVNRHATFANKKCLCEMNEAIVWAAEMHV